LSRTAHIVRLGLHGVGCELRQSLRYYFASAVLLFLVSVHIPVRRTITQQKGGSRSRPRCLLIIRSHGAMLIDFNLQLKNW